MRHTFLAAVLLALLWGAPSPAGAGDPPEEEPAPGELAREGVERLLQALEVFIEMIPQYELPELNENGDIIIRRKRDRGEDPAVEPDDDQTST